jgi:hypothetical protein
MSKPVRCAGNGCARVDTMSGVGLGLPNVVQLEMSAPLADKRDKPELRRGRTTMPFRFSHHVRLVLLL